MKVLGNIAKLVFIICLPVLFFTASIAWGFNSLWLYEYGFQKYNVSQSTGIPESQLNKAAQDLISYFNSNEEYVHITITANGQSFPLFTQPEQIHFRDVKALVWLDYKGLIVTFCLAAGYILTLIFWRRGKYRRSLAKSVIWGSGISLALLAVLSIASMLDFEQLFLDFHYLAFTNMDWSAPGYMLMLFPGGFWYDAAFICISFMVGLAFIFGVSGIVYLRFTRRRTLARAGAE